MSNNQLLFLFIFCAAVFAFLRWILLSLKVAKYETQMRRWREEMVRAREGVLHTLALVSDPDYSLDSYTGLSPKSPLRQISELLMERKRDTLVAQKGEIDARILMLRRLWYDSLDRDKLSNS